MWAASLTPSQPWASITLPSSTTVKAPLHMCLPVPKFWRKSRSRDHDHKEVIGSTRNQKNTGAVGQAVPAAAFKSKPEQQPSHPEVRVLKPQRESQIKEQNAKASPQEQGRQLSGSDVLRALQIASVEKAKQSLKQKKVTNKKRNIMTSAGGEQLALDDHTKSSIGPLCIKSEWGVRLEELEKRLREIMLLDHV